MPMDVSLSELQPKGEYAAYVQNMSALSVDSLQPHIGGWSRENDHEKHYDGMELDINGDEEDLDDVGSLTREEIQQTIDSLVMSVKILTLSGYPSSIIFTVTFSS